MSVSLFVVQPTGIGWPDYITAISDPSSIAQAVYFDSVAGVAGTNYPTGTASAPVNNFPDLRTICTNRSIHKIVNIDISVLATLDAAMLNYEFVNWFLDLNGQDVTDSQFKQCSLIGIAGGTNLLASDSILSNVTNAGQPYLSGCVISNNFVLPTGVGVSASLINCEYLNCVMFVNDNTVDVIGGTGTLTVRDVDNVASVLNIYGFGGYIILANTCTLGIINLYGDFVLTRASLAGSVVNDYRISKEYGQEAIYYNSVGGEAGTAYPIGRADRPVNNFNDLVAICIARKITTIVLLSDITLLDHMLGYYIKSQSLIFQSSVFTNGKLLFNMTFENVRLDGAITAGSWVYCLRCTVLGKVGIGGWYENCELAGTHQIGAALTLRLNNCSATGAGCTLNFASGAGGMGAWAYLKNCHGLYTISNCNDGMDRLEFMSNDARLTINNTCTLGNILLFGALDLVNNSAGSTITDYRNKAKLEDAVYYDAGSAFTGTQYPIGTAQKPVNNLPDLRAILTARNLKTIILLSSITLDAAMEGYFFKGFAPNNETLRVVCSSKSINNSSFENVYLNGPIANSDQVVNCLRCAIDDKSRVSGVWEDCTTTGIMIVSATQSLFLHNCLAQSVCTISLVNDGGAHVYIQGCRGIYALRSVTELGQYVLLDGGQLTIENTCNGGIISLYGDFVLVNNSAGSTVNDYRLSKRVVSFMDFWSLPQEEVAVTAIAGNKALPDVVVAGIPTGATIIRSVALFRFRVVENTFAGANSLSGAQAIQLQDDSPSGYINAINFVASMFTFTAVGREGGLIIEGAIDVKVPVDGIDTYNFQWTAAVAAQNNLQFNDVQVGLRVYFSP
jgi:hypothetical protein